MGLHPAAVLEDAVKMTDKSKKIFERQCPRVFGAANFCLWSAPFQR